ncbi:MAG: SurA N-terminal domain-containing protein [Desulfamplus sp.]|nr:SurA N-terminal domain-containing protein [Desulfamplus sp.]
MLRFMRENTGSWIIKVILGLIVVVFIFLGMGSLGDNRADHVAMVNETPITIDEYNRSYQNTVEQIRQRFGSNLSDEMLKMFQVKKQAMDRLIEERLISAQADKLEIHISDKELQESIISIPAFKKDGAFDLQTYRAVLTANRLMTSTFEDMQRETLRQSKVTDMILNSVKVSNLEAREWYIQNNSEVAVDYVKFDPASFNVNPDEAQIKEYYEKNKESYKSEPKLKVQYIGFASDDYKSKAVITPEIIESYYTSNPEEFTIPEQVEASHILIKVDENASDEADEAAKKEAEELYKRAVAGEDFAELAKEYSQDPSAKDNSGYLGKFAKNRMVKPFEDKAFSMEPGDISEPVKTQFGWHIIQVKSRTQELKQTLEEVSTTIKEKLLLEESKNLAYSAAGEAFDAIVDGDSLEQAALLLGQKVFEVGPFTTQGPDKLPDSAKSAAGADGTDAQKDAFPKAQEFAMSAFSLPLNEVSDVLEVGNIYYIIKPIEKHEPELLSFDDAKDKVVVALKSELQDQESKKAAETFLESIKSGESGASGETDDATKFVNASKDKGFELKSTQLFKKDGNIADIGREPEIAAAAFKLSETNRLVSEVIKASNSSYYVIAFKEKKIPGEDLIAENLDSVKKQLISTKQGAVYKAWIEELKAQSKIEIKPGLIDS